MPAPARKLSQGEHSSEASTRSLFQGEPVSGVERRSQASTAEVRHRLASSGINWRVQASTNGRCAQVEYTAALQAAPRSAREGAIYHANSAACYTALKRYPECVASCNAALLLDAQYAKALRRRMGAHEAQDQLIEALADAKQVRSRTRDAQVTVCTRVPLRAAQVIVIVRCIVGTRHTGQPVSKMTRRCDLGCVHGTLIAWCTGDSDHTGQACEQGVEVTLVTLAGLGTPGLVGGPMSYVK